MMSSLAVVSLCHLLVVVVQGFAPATHQHATISSRYPSSYSLIQKSPSFSTHSHRHRHFATERPFQDEDVNGATPSDTAGSSSSTTTTASASSAAVVLQSDSTTSRLASAFTALAENDQYDAVLTGLCAKILDDETETDQTKVQAILQDPVALLKEMNERNVPASARSLMSLIDATVQTQDANAMAGILSLSIQNGGITNYGTLQNDVYYLPSKGSSTKLTLADGTRKTRQERLDSLPDVPVDDRASEVSSALLASSVVGFCGAVNVLGFHDISPFTNTILTMIVLIGVLDNFYDVLLFVASLVVKDTAKNMPDKSSLPFGLGSGTWTGTVVKGLARLLSVDTERECEAEAAAFFAAYSLGLPCFAFRPNALEAAVLVVESMKPKGSDPNRNASLDPLLSDVGMMKMLIWLLAPVAMEASKHAQLIVSDPRESAGLLMRLEERVGLLEQDAMWWVDDEQEKEDMLKWAYAEADLLLREHKKTVVELSQRLAGGAATVGDCVAVMEDW